MQILSVLHTYILSLFLLNVKNLEQKLLLNSQRSIFKDESIRSCTITPFKQCYFYLRLSIFLFVWIREIKPDKAQITRPASCNFIFEHHNLMLLGATGCGKTYIACAPGMAAARQFLTVQYVRLPDLLTELAISGTTGTPSKTIDKYKNPALLRDGILF